MLTDVMPVLNHTIAMAVAVAIAVDRQFGSTRIKHLLYRQVAKHGLGPSRIKKKRLVIVQNRVKDKGVIRSIQEQETKTLLRAG